MRDEAVRRSFLDGLVEAVTDPTGRLRVVVTLRADFYDRPLQIAALAPLLEAASVAVTPLTPSELEVAIVEPAARVGASFEPGLVAQVAADVRDQPGGLPLLQYVLTELFDRSGSGVLTVEDYRQVGGVSGALSRRAEALFADADSEQQVATRRLFTRLVALGDSADTRRRVRASELGTAPATTQVIDRYGRARLLSFDRDPSSREPTIEVAHDALLREWPRLRGWLDDDRESLRLHRDLTTRADVWEASGRDPGELYRGARLDAAEQWAAAKPDELNQVEADFLQCALDQRQAELEARRRSARRMRRALVLTGVIAVIALVVGALAWQQQRRASASRFAAETGRLAALAPTLAGSDLSLSFLLAVEAERREEGPEAWSALQQSFVQAGSHLGFLSTDEPLRRIYFDGDDRIVGVATSKVTIWDFQSREPMGQFVLPVPPPERLGALEPIDFAGSTVAWVGRDGSAYVLDVDAGGEVRPVAPDADFVDVDPTGTRLAVMSKPGDVTVYALPGLEPLSTAKGDGAITCSDQIDALGLPPAPPQFASIEIQGVLGWTPDSQALVTSRCLHPPHPRCASGCGAGETVDIFGALVLTFDAAQPQQFVKLGANHEMTKWSIEPLKQIASRGLEYRPPGILGEAAAEALADGRVAVLDGAGELSLVSFELEAARGDRPSRRPGSGALRALRPAPSSPLPGQSGVALVGIDGSGLIHTTVPRTSDHLTLAGGPDASWVTSDSPPYPEPPEKLPSLRSAGRLWKCAEGSACAESTELGLDPTVQVSTVNTRPDLISVFDYVSQTLDTMSFFDAETLEPRSPVIEKEGTWQTMAAVAPGGQWVVADNLFPASVQVNELGSGRLLADLPIETPLFGGAGFAIPPSGELVLVTSLLDGNSFLIDATTWERRESPIPPGQASVAAFSPDGRWLATVGPSGDLSVRDPDTFEPIRQFALDSGTNEGIPVQSMAFSDDGRFLMTTHDTQGRLWEVETGRLIGAPIATLASSVPAALPGVRVGLLTASERWVEIWNFDVDAWADIACRAAGRNMTRAEWDQFGPREQGVPGDLPTVAGSCLSASTEPRRNERAQPGTWAFAARAAGRVEIR